MNPPGVPSMHSWMIYYSEMKTGFLAMGLLLALAGCGDPGAERLESVPEGLGTALPADTLRLLVYNIHHGEGMDEVTDLDRIAAFIRDLDPDLVALQEVDSVVARTDGADQAAVLGTLTGMTPVFGRFMAYQGGAYGMAVLSALPLLESRNVRLPNGSEPRSSVVVRVALPSGRALRLADVHFYETEDERLAQAMRLDSVLAADMIPTIMAGDFNSTPGSVVMNHLSGSWEILPKGDDRFTFSSIEPVREIDFVLVRPTDRFEVLTHHPLDEPLLSDHRPVWAEFLVR